MVQCSELFRISRLRFFIFITFFLIHDGFHRAFLIPFFFKDDCQYLNRQSNQIVDTTSLEYSSFMMETCQENNYENKEISIGRAIDILQHDYEFFLQSEMNFDIYTNDILLEDPSGTRMYGIEKYKKFFTILTTFSKVLFKDYDMKHVLYYEKQNEQIRIKWKLQFYLLLKFKPIIIEANSFYNLDNNGKVYEHVINNLVVNNKKIDPPYYIPYMEMYQFDKKLKPSFGVHAIIKNTIQWIKKQLSFCKSNEDCSNPQICCNYILFDACCDNGGGTEYYSHPYLKRPIRVRVEEDEINLKKMLKL